MINSYAAQHIVFTQSMTFYMQVAALSNLYMNKDVFDMLSECGKTFCSFSIVDFI